MTVGERIKKRRLELGLTQNELAERMGYTSRSAICTVEKDKEDLTTTRIRKFAEALQTTPAHLMGWQEVTTPLSGHDIDVVEVQIENTPDQETLDNNMMKRAIHLYDLYEQASPEIQAAVETLLKVSKSDS